MGNYFLLSWENHREPIASAISPKGSLSDHELINALEGLNKLPFDLNLIKIESTHQGILRNNSLTGISQLWLDYLPNNLALPLMSKRMKLVVDNNTSGNEQIDWITCNVYNGEDVKQYYILRFNQLLDVLDTERTLFVQGTKHIIRPVFSKLKIKKFSIFHKPAEYGLWKITSGLYVGESLKSALLKENLSGLMFEKTSVS